VIPVREEYHSYVAPRWFRSTVERLLSAVPESHLTGLAAIVLTNGMTFARDRRARRNRKRQSLGRYYVARRGEPAYIELIVDEIVKDVPAPFDRFQLPRDLTVGRVLFHEVGHHLHLTSRGVGRSNESSAELWKDRLSRMHIQRRYGYLRPFTPLLRLVRNVIKHR